MLKLETIKMLANLSTLKYFVDFYLKLRFEILVDNFILLYFIIEIIFFVFLL